MRVILDGAPLLSNNRGGIGCYCNFLVENLCKLDPSSEFTVLYNKSKIEHITRVAAQEKYVSYPYKNLFRIFGPHFLYNIPLESFIGSFDIFHGTETKLIPTRKAKKVITVHDLEYLSSPKTLSAKDFKNKSKQMPYYIKNADQIIAVSENTKNDIIKYYNIIPEKIHVIYLSADSMYRPISPEEYNEKEIRKKYGLPDRYILYVGGLYYRKNILNMLKAYALVKRRTQIEHRFVLVGMKADALQEIMNAIQILNLENDVVFHGYVELGDMPFIYNLADVFMHVSIFEGFGLPPLEAMACGLPVLVSNTSSLPEVVGDAGMQANPFDVEEISNKLELLLNEKVAWSYRQKGLERAKMFSCEKTAYETLEVYKLCLNT